MSTPTPVRVVDLHGTTRCATDGERAAVRAVLTRHGTPPPTDGVSVVFAYPGHGVGERHPQLSGCTNQMLLLSTAASTLTRLGVTVSAASTEPADRHAHLGRLSRSIARFSTEDAAAVPHVDAEDGRYLLRWTLVFGGPRDGLLVTDITDSVAHTRAVIDLVTADRLRGWAELVGVGPAPSATAVKASYASGVDSLGIVAFDAGVPLVAKVGPRAVIEAETAFVATVNGHLTERGQPPLFPVLYGVHREGAQATALMEHVDPLTLDDVVFCDDAKFVLSDDAVAVLEPHIELLSGLYGSTVRPQRPTVADYLLRERFHVLTEHEDFVGAFRSFFTDWDAGEVLAADVVLPTGARLPGYATATAWLDETAPALLPDSGCLVHGDVHLKNMLRRGDFSPVFVDPRTVWDGRDRPDAGFGDPSYDFATLLHSVLPMSGLLQAVAEGNSERLLPVLPARPGGHTALDLSGLRTPFTVDPALQRFEERLLTGLGAHPDPAILRARLYVGAANALAGWLKYEHALVTPQTWLATYAYVLWYLDRARAVLRCRGE